MQRFDELGADVAGADAVDPDVVRREFDGHGLGQLDHGRLAGAVVADLLRDVDDVPGHRGGGDDGAAAALPHHRPGRRLGGEKHPGHVGVLDALEFRGRHLEHRGDRDDAGIADRDVDAAEFGDHPVHHAAHLIGLGHVAADRDHTAGTAGGELVRGALQRLEVARRDGHPSAGLQIRLRHLLADPGGRPGDQRPPAAQVEQIQHAHLPSPFATTDPMN
ncbi:hypothetical protein MOKP125_12130 [Mycobacterium avium subsp. hominissuis]